MKKALEFFFDVGSPASYLAYTQLPRIAQQTGAEVALRPMLLGGVFQATGNRMPSAVPAKGKWMFDDFDRFARRYAVPFRLNPNFPINTLPTMRAITGLQMNDDPRLRAFLDEAFRRMWVEPRNLNDAAEVAALAQAAGIDAAQFQALVGEQRVKDRLKQTTEQAVARGVFGAPTLFVGDEMHFGQDRLDFVVEALQRTA